MKLSEAKSLRHKIEHAAALQTDEDALQSIELFPRWHPGMDVYAGERYRYNEQLWKVLLDHHTQADWSPDISPSLFVRVTIEEWPEWVQPISTETAYHIGDKVTHNESHWESDYDNNVWEPGVFGWTEQ